MPDTPIFNKKNVLVTGGAGFIGSFLCERLLKDSKVICVDNLATSSLSNIEHLLKNEDFEFINADISEPLDLNSYPELELFKVRFQGIQEVYNLACPTSVKNFEKFRHQTLLTNSVGMRNALDLAVKYKARFFQASAPSVYGPRPADDHLYREEEYGAFDHLHPRSSYDEGKRFAETMAYAYRDMFGIDVRVGRIFRTFGPRMALADGHMVPDFILDALNGRELVIYGDEFFRTTLVYVSDVLDAIERLMSAKEDPGPVNIGSDFDVRLADVAKMIIQMTGSSSTVSYRERLPSAFTVGVPDLKKLKGLGWVPLVSLEQGLKKSIEYAVAHKDILRPFSS